MKCNPLRWLWGLLPLAVLCWVSWIGESERIEADLRSRVEGLLKSQSLGWASIAFNGRDSIVVGEASDEVEQRKAYEVVRSTWGVRMVDDRTKLIDEEKNYLWSAVLRDGRVRVTGFAPSEALRKTVADAIKAALPGTQVEDRTRLARGAPSPQQWLAGINFALAQLRDLKSGKVDLEGLDLAIEGEARDSDRYKAVRTALAGKLPAGVKLRNERVTPPVVKPYTWAAKHGDGQLQLSGHVPGERQREELAALAKRLFPKTTVVDRMQTAAGEPADWMKGASSALTRLARLDDGTVQTRDAELSLTGLAADAAVADEVRKTLRADTPHAFRVSENIRVREPVIKPVSPFTTSAEVQGQAVVLSGYVPSEAAGKALAETARARLPGRRIDSHLQVAGGAPEGWTACAQAGLVALGRLGNGRMQMSDRALVVTAATEDEPLVAAVPAEVRTAVGRSCDADVRVTFDNRRQLEAAAAAEARRKSEEEAKRAAEVAAVEAARKAEEERKRAAELAAQRQAIDACQQTLTSLARSGVINFKRASAELEAQSTATLDKLARAMSGCPKARIEIEGHTDAEGTPERNQGLSERRARSVTDYLIRAGINAEHLVPIGYGESRPVAPNDTAANRARNRRIEFTVKMQ